MRQILFVTGVFVLLICLLSAIDISYPPAGFTTRHDSLQNLTYATSQHTGFAKETGNATITFECNNLNASGSLNSTGNLIYPKPPNNASFTLTGLSEKNYSSLTNKPTTFAGFGLTVASVTTYNTHLSTSTPHGILQIVNTASVTEHIATTTAHGGTVVDYDDIFDATIERPWHFNCENWMIVASESVLNRWGHTQLTFQNKIWVIAGAMNIGQTMMNDVWSSPDGITWSCATTSANFAPRRNHTSVVYDNKMWVIGGYDGSNFGDVWYSSDGITWTQATANADFSPRWKHSSVVFDNKMWVMLGVTSSYVKDSWYSTDGITWTQASANLGFSVKELLAVAVYDNKIWFSGGYVVNPYTGMFISMNSDLYYSTDGITSTLATTTTEMRERFGHSIINYNGKLWCVGGGNLDGDYTDILYSTNMLNWTVATNTYQGRGFWDGVTATNGRIYKIGGFGYSKCYATYLTR